MSDWVTDTPDESRAYCPSCEPEADPETEILQVRWCAAHTPQMRGTDDNAATGVNAWISGSSECEGTDNARWCAFFHRKRP